MSTTAEFSHVPNRERGKPLSTDYASVHPFASYTQRRLRRREMLAIGAAAIGVSRRALADSHPTDPGIYFDQHGLIVQRDGDGGDTAQREGFVWFGKWIYKSVTGTEWPITLPISFQQSLDLLEVKPGEFCRHPTQIDPSNPEDPKWKMEPDRSSRDQVTPIIAAMGVWDDQQRLLRLWNAKRPCNFILTCVQGTKDIFGPELVNLYRRARHEAPDPQGDTATLLGVVARIAAATKDPDDTSDDLNQIVHLLMCKVRSPSSDTDKAATLYATTRPLSSGAYLAQYRRAYPGGYDTAESTMLARIKDGVARGWKPECPPALAALRWYFRPETGGCSSLAELYAPAIQRWLS